MHISSDYRWFLVFCGSSATEVLFRDGNLHGFPSDAGLELWFPLLQSLPSLALATRRRCDRKQLHILVANRIIFHMESSMARSSNTNYGTLMQQSLLWILNACFGTVRSSISVRCKRWALTHFDPAQAFRVCSLQWKQLGWLQGAQGVGCMDYQFKPCPLPHHFDILYISIALNGQLRFEVGSIGKMDAESWSSLSKFQVLQQGMLILYLMLASMLAIDVFMGHVLFTSLDAWWSLVEPTKSTGVQWFQWIIGPVFDLQRTLELLQKLHGNCFKWFQMYTGWSYSFLLCLIFRSCKV